MTLTEPVLSIAISPAPASQAVERAQEKQTTLKPPKPIKQSGARKPKQITPKQPVVTPAKPVTQELPPAPANIERTDDLEVQDSADIVPELTHQTVDEKPVLQPPIVKTIKKPVPLYKLTRQPSGVLGKPSYPQEARDMGKEGRGMASNLVDTDGTVIEVTILESGGEIFDNAVIEWLMMQRLLPGFINDEPVVSVFKQAFEFKLQ